MNIAAGRLVHAFGVPAGASSVYTGVSQRSFRIYYVRLMVDDQPGVFAEIAAELAKHEILKVYSAIPFRDRSVPVVMTTHETSEAAKSFKRIRCVGRGS